MVAHPSRIKIASGAGSSGDGYEPSDLQSAYNLTAASESAGADQTVAVVDAFDDPDAQSDLDTYRSEFGLPACDAGCFRKVNEQGATSPLPKNNQSWAGEISLDLDMVSAICPNCHIMLIEAKSAKDADLGASVNTAASLGADEISNSYGGPEKAQDLKYDRIYYDHPGIAVLAGSGDSGYGVDYPAASPYVTAVGGTTLTPKSHTSRGWTESAWSGGGSGCSTTEPKPAWQADTGCSMRTVADVAVDADPNTGVLAYDTDCSEKNFFKGVCFYTWGIVGGTSVGAPVVAGIYALAGNAGTLYGGSLSGAESAYANPTDLYDVTSGNNGNCATAYLCTAGPGYDGPTGLGSPDGIGAF